MKKKRENIENNEPLNGAAENVAGPERSKFDLGWFFACGAVIALAAFMRFFALGIKPFHHDEGVNGHFLMSLFRDGVYKYDPANYHGPTLYYIALAFTKVFGLETLPVRWSVAVWGVLIVVFALFLRRFIGRAGSLFAAVFLALSPGMVYISRYFIHEIFFVFLGLALVISIAFFIQDRKAGPFAIFWATLLLMVSLLPTSIAVAFSAGSESAVLFWITAAAIVVFETSLVLLIVRMLIGWRDGRPVYLLLASACAALMFATKETTFITLGTMLIACLCLALWRRIYPPFNFAEADLGTGELAIRNFRTALGIGTDRLLLVVGCVAVFTFLGVLFFSSFFTYPQGVGKAFEAYAIWTKTGSKDHTQNGMWAYFKWGMEIEAPIMILSAVGILIAFLRSRNSFAMFTGLWAFGLFAAYTIIPYKTPWLALSFLLPMCIMAGYAIGELFAAKQKALTAIGAITAAAASIVLAFQSYDLNFVRYDDESKPYVYAHTKREFLDMVRSIEQVAVLSGKGNDAAIQIVSPDYWPLVWYTKDFPSAIYHGRMASADGAEMIVAKTPDQDAEVARRFSAEYKPVGKYGLRPGVDLVLLARRDLAVK